MTNLIETPVYETGIYQLAVTDPYLGGQPAIVSGTPVAGWVNAPLLQLANRTAFLNDNSKKLADYAALRAYTGSATRIEITNSGIAGTFLRKSFVVGDTDNAGTRILSANGLYTWDREFSTDVKIGWFATVSIGSNDTIGLSNALNYVFSNNKTLIIDQDIHTTRITITSGMGGVICTTGTIMAHTSLPVIDVFDNMLLDFRSGVTRSQFNIIMDLQNKGASGIFIRGTRNTIEADVRNSISSIGQTFGTVGVNVSGDYCDVPFVRCTNFISVPSQGAGAMAVAVTGLAKDVQVGKIVAEGGSGALINTGHGTQVDTIFVDGCLDNGIYDVDGAVDLHVGTIYAKNCPDEVVAFSFSVRGRVDTVVAVNCGRGVGVTNAVSPSVGEIYWRVDADSTIDSGSPLYCRPNQTVQTNSIEVDRLVVRGTWKTGAPVFSFQNFGIARVSIGEIDADVTYTDATATKSLSFFDSLNTCVDIGKLSVTVRDGIGTLTSSDIFTLNVVPTTALTSYSAIGGFHIGNGGGLLSIRVPRINDPKLVVNDKIRIRSDIGTPFATNEDDPARSRDFYSGSVPTTGDWLRGDTVWKITPSASGYMGWVCAASGTPGTWKQFGLIEA